MAEDEMVGWHYQLNVHEFEQAARDGEGQGRKPGHAAVHGAAECDRTDRLNNKNISVRLSRLAP